MPSLEESDLEPGDILLSLGKGDLSDAIKGLDGGSYSHAAIWSGSDVIEATLPKVKTIALSGSRDKARYIDVYRYKGGSAQTSSVVAEARSYLGTAYAEADLLLATAILSVSSWMPNEWSELNFLFGAGKLRRLTTMLLRIHRQQAPERVTCVGLAARAHLQAELPIQVALQSGRSFDPRALLRAVKQLLAVSAQHRAASEHESIANDETSADFLLVSELEAALQQGARPESTAPAFRLNPELDSITPELEDSAEDDHGFWHAALVSEGIIPALPVRVEELTVEDVLSRRFVAGGDWSAALVTPRQLEKSESLERVGRVWASGET